MWHVMDKLAMQEANAVQRTPCIPEQIADHQENVIITCEDTRNHACCDFPISVLFLG